MEFTDALGNKYLLPKGKKAYKRISVYPIVFNKQGKLLLYMPKYNPQWQLPGGGLDQESKETPQQAAERECLEETGYRIKITDEKPFFTGKQNFYHRGEEIFYISEHLFFNGKLQSGILDSVSEEDKEGQVTWKKLTELDENNTHQIIHPVLRLLKERVI